MKKKSQFYSLIKSHQLRAFIFWYAERIEKGWFNPPKTPKDMRVPVETFLETHPC